MCRCRLSGHGGFDQPCPTSLTWKVTMMSWEIDRRALLKLSALAGGALAVPALLPGVANAAGSARRPGKPAPVDLGAEQVLRSVRRPRFSPFSVRVTDFG